MKKVISTIILLISFIPFVVLGATTSYEKIDIKINFEIGTTAENIKYSIYANTNEDEILRDRTEEFESNIVLFKVNEYGSKEELASDYIIKKDERYGFRLNDIKPINNATMNINESSKLLVNANEYDGERLKRTISNNVLNVEYVMEEVKIEEPEDIEPIIEEKEENNCLLGVEFCCKEYRGISYCILAGIGLVLIILIFAIIHLIIDRADDKKYKDF